VCSERLELQASRILQRAAERQRAQIATRLAQMAMRYFSHRFFTRARDTERANMMEAAMKLFR
jgi:hypothetical protein